MEMIQLGRTGVAVSRLGFGGAPAGLPNYLVDFSPADRAQRSQVIAALQKAVELGVTYFDTAPAYGNGASEAVFGEALAGLGDRIFVATKVVPDETDLRASVERSLTRLRRDSLDLLQIHGNSYSADTAGGLLAPGGLMDQMEALRDEGLIRFLGFTSEDNNIGVDLLIASERFDVMQIGYNLLFQHPYEATRPFGSMVEAEARGMGICTMRALTSGIFQKWLHMVNPADDFDYAPALLQFVLSNPVVDVALVGMRTPDEVVKNVAICHDLSGRIDVHALHAKFVA